MNVHEGTLRKIDKGSVEISLRVVRHGMTGPRSEVEVPHAISRIQAIEPHAPCVPAPAVSPWPSRACSTCGDTAPRGDAQPQSSYFSWQPSADVLEGKENLANAVVATQFADHHLLLGLCVIASGLWLVAYAVAPTLPVAAAVLFLSGASFPPLIVSFMTLIQLETEDAFLGRVMSLVNTGMSVAMIASLAGGGTLADLFGVRQVIGGGAILLVVSGLLSLVAIRSTPAPRVGTAASAAPATTTSTVYDVTS